MRLAGIALALLSLSCSTDPGSPDPDRVADGDNLQPSAFSFEDLSVFSKYAGARGIRSVITGDDARFGRGEGLRSSALSVGQLSLTLLNGAVRPTFCDTLTFQRDAFGRPILAGADVSDAYEDAGISVGVLAQDLMTPGLPIAFDSSNPTGGDFDLGTPNSRYGGPGAGEGGATNDRALGNLLIKAENACSADLDGNDDGLVDDPDDDANGGWFRFDFAEDKCVSRADLIDVESAETPVRIRFYDGQENFITEIEAGGLGDNSVEHRKLDVCGVRHLKFGLPGSGALNDVVVCNTPEPVTDVNFDVDINNITTFEFDLVLYLDGAGGSVKIAQTRTELDPMSAIQGQRLLPVPVASNVIVPAGSYSGVRVELTNVEAIAHDGSRTPLAGGVVKAIDHGFEVRDCGSTHFVANWTIDSRIEGDLLGLGVGLTFDRPMSRQDTTGCP